MFYWLSLFRVLLPHFRVFPKVTFQINDLYSNLGFRVCLQGTQNKVLRLINDDLEQGSTGLCAKSGLLL